MFAPVNEGIFRMRLILAMSLIAAGAACGQAASNLRFEVASIKPGGDVFSTRPDRTKGRLRWTTQLCYLIGYAYRLDFSQVSGPKNGSIYSVEAIFDPAATEDQFRLMLQSLLAERFKLELHRVTAQSDGYALVVGSVGLKVKEVHDSDEPPAMPDWVKDASPALKARTYIAATVPEPGVTAITGRRVSISQLAETLQRVTKMPVWDRTGLSGNYYFAFRYAQEVAADVVTDAPSLATALKESLGLKLEKRKRPVETLVIDHVEEPSEN
jgi:uncharacterized protein (TIGR03435 family)